MMQAERPLSNFRTTSGHSEVTEWPEVILKSQNDLCQGGCSPESTPASHKHRLLPASWVQWRPCWRLTLFRLEWINKDFEREERKRRKWQEREPNLWRQRLASLPAWMLVAQTRPIQIAQSLRPLNGHSGLPSLSFSLSLSLSLSFRVQHFQGLLKMLYSFGALGFCLLASFLCCLEYRSKSLWSKRLLKRVCWKCCTF